MRPKHLIISRLVVTACSWLAIVMMAVILLDDLLFGVESALDPRIIDAIIGIATGIVLCLILAPIISCSFQIISIAKMLAIGYVAILIMIEELTSLSLSIANEFTTLVIASFIAWIDAMKTRAYELSSDPDGMPSVHSTHVVLVFVTMVAGGSLWQQRENFYTWTGALEIMLVAIPATTIVIINTIHVAFEKHSKAADDSRSCAKMGESMTKLPGTVSLLALFCGVTCGLYMSLSMLIAQNTSLEYPTILVYFINICISVAVFTASVLLGSGSSRSMNLVVKMRSLLELPLGLVFMLLAVFASVGLPWLLATLDLVDFSTAGTLHVGALVTVPLLGYFMISRLANINITNVHAPLIVTFGGLGFIIGIAGYLVGGNTYNMDFYIGLAYTVLFMFGVVTAWLYKPRGRDQCVQGSITRTDEPQVRGEGST